ncbi:hypothetical protein JXB28_00380 [Candidatus Woesearchaeota archaeon]|nr:hypothetical protein [Candidatus Woesearchaeota archaeon]
MKRIKIIQIAISFLQGFELILQGKAEAAKTPAADQQKPKEPDRLIALKKKLIFLEQEFKRVSDVTNPNIAHQEAELKRRSINDGLRVAADLLADIPIMEGCPIAPFCEKCKDTSIIYHGVENLFNTLESQLQHLEFGSCHFISHLKENRPAC